LGNNAALEARWVAAWSALAELNVREGVALCLFPDGQTVDAEACRAWLQDSVYDGWQVDVASGWVLGRPGVIVSRWKSED